MSDTAAAVLAELELRGLVPLLREISAARGVTELELCGSSRTPAAARARQELWARITELPGRDHSMVQIARWFRRDPSTVCYGVAQHRRRRH